MVSDVVRVLKQAVSRFRLLMLCLWIVIALSGGGESLRAQTPAEPNYVISYFSMEDGLPQSSVNDIVQTDDGYMWLATYGGLVRFDGSEFKVFDRFNTPGMESDRLLKLFPANDGSVWLFSEDTKTKLYRFKDGSCDGFYISDSTRQVLDLYEDEDHNLWLTANQKVLKFDGSSFKPAIISRDLSEADPARTGEGGWMVAGSSVYRTYEGKVYEAYNLGKSYMNELTGVAALPGQPGTVLIGTISKGIKKINVLTGSETGYNEADGLPNLSFLRFRIDRNGNLFAIHFANIVKWQQGRFVGAGLLPEGDTYEVKSILQDHEGNYWLGTGGNGLIKVRPTPVRMIDKSNGLNEEIMLSLTRLKDGSMLFSTNCSNVYEWKDGEIEISDLTNIHGQDCLWSVFQDSRGNIWAGSGDLYRTDEAGENGISYNGKQGYAGGLVFAITEDRKGRVWISTSDRIYRYSYEDRYFTRFRTEDGLYYPDSRTLFEDSRGLFWVGTKQGLNIIEDDSVRKFPLTGDESEPYIRAIYEDQSRYIWVGTYGNGLFRINGNEIQQLTTDDGLFDNIISHLVEDEYGNFWMGSNRGITRISRFELNAYLDGRADAFKVTTYGRADGMNSPETNGGFQPNAVQDTSGNIYFPTVEGVAVVSTRMARPNEMAAPVFINSYRTGNDGISYTDSISLDYNAPFLEINYSAIHFTDPDKVRYRYKLEGLNDEWIDVGNRKSAIYSKIPPGEYTFRVSASNNDGLWNTESAFMNISVIPPFWQTTWFYGILTFLFLSSGPSIYYLRVKQLRKENERQKKFTEELIESQENERERIASELHDGLGQQILVIKNRAELLKKQNGLPDDIAGQLTEIRNSADLSIRDIRTISHGLRPVMLEKFGLAESLRQMCSQMQNTSEIEWNFYVDNIDGFISPGKEIHFFRVIQEAMNNIMKHAEATEAIVMVMQKDEGLEAVIRDDGKGFDPVKAADANGLGFTGMKERIEALGGSVQVISAPGEGTKISLLIPQNK